MLKIKTKPTKEESSSESEQISEDFAEYLEDNIPEINLAAIGREISNSSSSSYSESESASESENTTVHKQTEKQIKNKILDEVYPPPVPQVTSAFAERLKELEEGTFSTDVEVIKKKTPKNTLESKFIHGDLNKPSRFISVGDSNVDIDDIEDLIEVTESSLEESKIEAFEKSTAKVLKVDKKRKSKFTKKLNRQLQKIQDFFIHEIAPAQLSFDSSIYRVKEELSLILGEDMDNIEFNNARFSALSTLWEEMILMKSYSFLSGVLKLSDKEALPLLFKYLTPKDANLEYLEALQKRMDTLVKNGESREVMPTMREIRKLQRQKESQ